MLGPLGISAEAEALYVRLAPRAAATVADLDGTDGSGPEQTRARLAELRSVGLATEVRPGSWQALPLLGAATALRAQRIVELDAAVVAAESLQNHLTAALHPPTDNVQILIGREAILAARGQMFAEASKEICTFDKPPYVQARPNVTEEELSRISPEWQSLERGLALRCVYHPGFDADRLAELALFAAKGEKSRTAPTPMKLILADAQVALIPSMRSYEPGQELRASVVRHPLLVEALQWLFEAVWDTSVPIVTGYSESDPRKQMLISLLMTGSTDNAIATQLGINVRSVRRWISELMDELGVTTRLQLGAALVRSDTLKQALPVRR